MSEDQIKEFYEVGFTIVRNLFEPDELKEMSEALDRLYATGMAFDNNTDYQG